MINRQDNRLKKKLTRYLTLKRRIASLLSNYEIEDTKLITIIDSQIDQLSDELSDCAGSKSGEINDFSLHLSNLSNIPSALVKSRLLLGWSQGELARRVGLTRQKVHIYEKTSYGFVAFSRLLKIATILQDGLNRRRQQIESGGILRIPALPPALCKLNLKN